MHKRKVVEVEQLGQQIGKTAKARLIALKDQALPTPRFEEGQKVRYTTVYGTVEPKPYRILSRSLQYEWLNDMNFAYLYRLRRWDAHVEEHGWADWHTATVWESQISPWIPWGEAEEIVDIAQAQERALRNAAFMARVEEAAREVLAEGIPMPQETPLVEEEPEREVLNVDLEVSDYIAGVTILNDAPDVYVTFTITEQGEQPWLTLRLQSK